MRWTLFVGSARMSLRDRIADARPPHRDQPLYGVAPNAEDVVAPKKQTFIPGKRDRDRARAWLNEAGRQPENLRTLRRALGARAASCDDRQLLEVALGRIDRGQWTLDSPQRPLLRYDDRQETEAPLVPMVTPQPATEVEEESPSPQADALDLAALLRAAFCEICETEEA